MIKKCLQCGKPFHAWPGRISITKYCSQICFHKTLKGRKLSEEIKFRMSSAQKGHGVSKETKRKISEARKNFTGWKHSKETIKKMSNSRKKFVGEKCPMWRGGKTKNSAGYVMIYKPDHPNNIGRYVSEHRLVMEKHIGRYLTHEEVIHHINGIITDNRIENLKLFSNDSEHAKFHHHSYLTNS
jgi:hypothetical protein